jgi:ABC-2 type transport system ATP-binding protein
MSDDIAIELRGLTKRFGGFVAVNQLSFEIRRGEALGFLGPNGAGKSTTMKMLAGILKPDGGTIRINHDGQLTVLSQLNQDALLTNLGFLIEAPEFYDTLTPRQLLTYFARLKGYPKNNLKRRVEEVVNMVGMSDWIDQPLRKFSKGMKQKIGVAQAFVHDPQIIVLDEPHSGLDPTARIGLRKLILLLKSRGKTLFISSHILHEIAEVCERVAIINHGQLLAFDTMDNLEELMEESAVKVEILAPLSTEETNPTLLRLMDDLRVIEGVLTESKPFVRYIPEMPGFEIQFDGRRETQANIFRVLAQTGLAVVEYSVPKTELLESLYMRLLSQSDHVVKQQVEIAEVLL